MSLTTHFKTLIFLGIVLMTCSAVAYESKINLHAEDVECQSYVTTIDRIIMTNEGIFVDLDSMGMIPISSITWLQNGHCLITYKDPDCGHTVYCTKCGGCDPTNRCQYRCKCQSRR
jgi:hypothetical protein